MTFGHKTFHMDNYKILANLAQQESVHSPSVVILGSMRANASGFFQPAAAVVQL